MYYNFCSTLFFFYLSSLWIPCFEAVMNDVMKSSFGPTPLSWLLYLMQGSQTQNTGCIERDQSEKGSAGHIERPKSRYIEQCASLIKKWLKTRSNLNWNEENNPKTCLIWSLICIFQIYQRGRGLVQIFLYFPDPTIAKMTEPLRVVVTGAAGQIGYSLVYMIACGSVFGDEQPLILQVSILITF